MKKLLSIVVATLFALTTNASTDVTSIDNAIYPLDAVGQVGGTATITIELKSAVPVANLQFTAIEGLPEGVTYNSGSTELTGYGVADGTTFVVSTQSDANFFAEGTYNLAKLVYNVASTVALGDYTIKIPYSYIGSSVQGSSVEVSTAMEATLHIQRAAAVEPQSPDYAFEIIPFTAEAGKTYQYDENKNIVDNSIPVVVNLKNLDYVKQASFDLTLPTGFGIAYAKSGMKSSSHKPEVKTSRSYNVNEGGDFALAVNQGSLTDGKVTYTLTSTGDGDFVKDNGSGELCKIYLTTTAELAAGVYTLKLSNISITSTPDGESLTTHEGGEALFSVFVGEPTEANPIVYGHYTTAGQAALKAASTNFASVDMSEATVDAKETALAADLAGILVYGPENTSYNRSVTGYGTVCLPFDLTSGNGTQYYTLSQATDNALTFVPAATVAANTPALVKGNIAASVEGYKYADPSATLAGATAGDFTMKGTYEKISISGDSNYYIANNYFWNDGATVAPFRGYFVTTAPTPTAKLSVFIADATGVHEITGQLSNEDIYNLQGIKLNKARKGVNIIGGKKVLVK